MALKDRDIPASEIARWLDIEASPQITDMWAKIAKQAIIQLPGSGILSLGGGLSGSQPAHVWFDELATLKNEIWDVSPMDLALETYETEGYPNATVRLYSRKLDKHDPRNPNPVAGSHEVFYSVVNGRESQSTPKLALAKMQAENLHKRLVAALQEEERAKEQQELDALADEMTRPGYGRF